MGLTALGAATVFLAKDISRKVLDFMLAFAGGVMIAASFWSLLAPGIEMAELQGQIAWIPAVVGFLVGGGFCDCATGFCRICIWAIPWRRPRESTLTGGGRPCWCCDHPAQYPEGLAVGWHSAPSNTACPRPVLPPPVRWRWESAFRIFPKAWRFRCRFVD